MHPSYNSKYNRELVKILNETVPNMGQSIPMLPQRITHKYVLPGNAPDYMHSDQAEREGSGFGKKLATAALNVAPVAATLATVPLMNPFISAGVGIASHKLRQRVKEKTGYGRSGGKITKDKIVSGAKKAARIGVPVALDLIPAAATVGASALTGNPLVGLAAGTAARLARNGIKEFTGYGLNTEKVKKVAKRVGKVVASTALDVAPVLAAVAGAAATGDASTGLPVAAVTKIAREAIRHKYGLGMKQCGHKRKCKCGQGLNKQKIKNIAKKSATVLLDSAPFIAGLAASDIADAELPGGIAYGATQAAREFIRHKTGLGLHNKKLSKKIILHLNKHYKRKNVIGGSFDFNFDTFQNELGPMIKKYISQGLELAIPVICEEISKHFLGNKKVGKQAGEYIKHIIKNYVGLGFDMSEYKQPMKYLPDRGRPSSKPNSELPFIPIRPSNIRPRVGGGRKLNSKLQNRNKVVKQIMKEKGLSLIETSKYVAKNKIKY